MRAICFSKLGRAAIGPRPGSGTWVLFFEVTAVEFTTSGHSLIIPRGDGAKVGTLASECFAW